LSRPPNKGDTVAKRPPKERESFCRDDQISRHGVAFLRLSDGLGRRPRLPLAARFTDHRPEVQADLRGAQMLALQQPLQSRQADLPSDADEAWPEESCHLGRGGHPSKF